MRDLEETFLIEPAAVKLREKIDTGSFGEVRVQCSNKFTHNYVARNQRHHFHSLANSPLSSLNTPLSLISIHSLYSVSMVLFLLSLLPNHILILSQRIYTLS